MTDGTTTEETSESPIAAAVRPGYQFEGPALELGGLMLDATTLSDVPIRIPLGMLNRHGLVAGATGTGKTKTLQLLAEQLSANGVPVFAADIKGDLSGLSAPGEERKTAAAAISCGKAKRPVGMRFLAASPFSPAQAFLPSSVSTIVGEIVLTLMPCLPHSAAKVLDMPMTPNFEAQ